MELDKEFIQEINKIVEEILDKKQTLISKNTLEEIKNKWNEERLQKTEAILNSYKSLNDFIKTINFTNKEFKAMERQQIKDIMKNNFTENETFLERVYKSNYSHGQLA